MRIAEPMRPFYLSLPGEQSTALTPFVVHAVTGTAPSGGAHPSANRLVRPADIRRV